MKVIFPNSGSYIAQGLTKQVPAVGAQQTTHFNTKQKTEVYGIELSSNVTSQERFTRERSRPINVPTENSHDLTKRYR